VFYKNIALVNVVIKKTFKTFLSQYFKIIVFKDITQNVLFVINNIIRNSEFTLVL